jgi:hypothetical protein
MTEFHSAEFLLGNTVFMALQGVKGVDSWSQEMEYKNQLILSTGQVGRLYDRVDERLEHALVVIAFDKIHGKQQDDKMLVEWLKCVALCIAFRVELVPLQTVIIHFTFTARGPLARDGCKYNTEVVTYKRDVPISMTDFTDATKVAAVLVDIVNGIDDPATLFNKPKE